MSGLFRFGGYELDIAAYALRREGESIKLEKMPMELLVLLVQRAGALVSRSELQGLWGADVHVDHDAAINTAIRKIRHALADDATTPRFVETVVGKGYRFVARVDRGTSEASWYEPGAKAATPPSGAARAVFPRYSLRRGKHEFILQAGDTVVGRDPTAGVCVDHPSVSRRHACISVTNGGAMLTDLGSRNGTFLNGRRIDQSVTIEDAAIIGLGPVMLTFVVLTAPPSTRSMTGAQPE